MKAFFAAIFTIFFLSPFTISGNSMEPFLSDHDVILVDSYTYNQEAPQRGDVIVFRGTDEPDKFFVKRVIGLPGETVIIREDDVYINETKLDEPYVYSKDKIYSLRQIDGTQYEVPEGKYFVLGDNRDSSFDSRTWRSPFVPKNNIVGKYYTTL